MSLLALSSGRAMILFCRLVQRRDQPLDRLLRASTPPRIPADQLNRFAQRCNQIHSQHRELGARVDDGVGPPVHEFLGGALRHPHPAPSSRNVAKCSVRAISVNR
ncbi:hypothetical protein [Nocardia sp. NPDC051981]|uniref:hypothetical protein n=1 Tax=Nocardia sp. NPDC051981 TaxID=3155417 RepID=UPI003419AFCD